MFHTTKTFLNTPFSLIYHIFTFLNLENLQNSSITYFDPRTLPQTHILTDLKLLDHLSRSQPCIKDSIWVAWVREVLLRQGSIWNGSIPSRCSWSWRKILQLRDRVDPLSGIKHVMVQGPFYGMIFFFFWINKNLFPKGQNPTKNTHEVKKTPKKKKRKTDSTSPKTEEKGHQPETKIHLINGRQTTLWHDFWNPLGSILPLFGERIIYDSAIHRNARVADVMDGSRWNWPVTVSADLLVLKNSCTDYLLDINREDVISWTQSNTGVFTVSSAWNSIRPRRSLVHWHAAVWFSQSIKRHSFISWLVIQDRLSTQDKLMK